jgi:hypothetical protein
MDNQIMAVIITQVVSFIFGLGLIYGTTNARIKSIEKEMTDNKDTIERLTRIEEQMKMLINHFIKI